MKTLRKLSGLALVLLGGVPCSAWAQGVGIPAAATALPAGVAAPVPAGLAAPVPVAAAPPRNLWTFLCPTPAMKAACKARFCASQFGRLINNSLAPMSVFTGGVIPQPCPLIDPANLLKDPTSALGAAAQIQKDTAEAAARRVAVRYMSTADCNWWPEATAALSGTLRTDRNECVRLEAAVALQRGCCCNRITIRALVDALSVFPGDGNPPEDSPRVRAAAMAALQHCLSCFVAYALPAPAAAPVPPAKEALPPGEAPPLKGPPLVPVPAVPVPAVPVPVVPGPVLPPTAAVADGQPSVRPATYRAAVPEKSMEQLVQEARVVLQQAKQREALLQRRAAEASGSFRRPVDRSLIEVIENALHPPTPQPAKNTRVIHPPQATGTNGTITFPPEMMPAPQVAPATLAPQTQAMPAVYSPVFAAPAPVEPVSVTTPPPSATPLPTASSSYVPNQAPVSSTPSPAVSTPVSAATQPAGAGQPPSVSHLLVLLMSAESSVTRQRAAEALPAQGERTPIVVQALVNGAASDVSAEVRDACLQSLLQFGVSDPVLLAQAEWPLIEGDSQIREAVWRFVLFGTEARENPRVHEGAKVLNQWFQSRSAVVRPART